MGLFGAVATRWMELGIQPLDCVGNGSCTCWVGVCVCVVSERETERRESGSISRLAPSLDWPPSLRMRLRWMAGEGWRGEFRPGRAGHPAERGKTMPSRPSTETAVSTAPLRHRGHPPSLLRRQSLTTKVQIENLATRISLPPPIGLCTPRQNSAPSRT